MEGLDFSRTYLDELLCLCKGRFDEHLEGKQNLKKVTKCKPAYKRYNFKFWKDQNRLSRVLSYL